MSRIMKFYSNTLLLYFYIIGSAVGKKLNTGIEETVVVEDGSSGSLTAEIMNDINFSNGVLDSSGKSSSINFDEDAENIGNPIAVVGVAFALALLFIGGIISVQVKHSPCHRVSKTGGKRKYAEYTERFENDESSFYNSNYNPNPEQEMVEDEMQQLFMYEHPDKLDSTYMYAKRNL